MRRHERSWRNFDSCFATLTSIYLTHVQNGSSCFLQRLAELRLYGVYDFLAAAMIVTDFF